MKKKLLIPLIVLSLTLFLAGCEGVMDGFTDFNDGYGELVLNIADRPVNDVDKVLVTIDEVQVSREGEEWEVINDFADEDGEKEFDLMELRFVEDVLAEATLETGNYEGIRLIVAAEEGEEGDEVPGKPSEKGKSKVVYENGDEDNIFIPSGMQSGLKIKEPFVVEEEAITELTLDVNVNEMMHAAGKSGIIILKPVMITPIDEVNAGNLEGNTLDKDGNPITDKDVVIEAYKEGEDEAVKSTVALSRDDTENDRKAGTFMLRGLEEGNYRLEAYVVKEDGDEKIEVSERVSVNIDVEAGRGVVNELKEDIIIEDYPQD